MSDIYIIDSSLLIDFHDEYPPELQYEVWRKFEKLIKDRQIIAPIEVKNEIYNYNDFWYEWCKKYELMFYARNDKIKKFVDEIVNKFPKLVELGKEEYSADPYIIALGRLLMELGDRPIILTQENDSTNNIPGVARFYNVESMNLKFFKIKFNL